MIVKQLDYDLTPVPGLSLVGYFLKSKWPVFKREDATLPIKWSRRVQVLPLTCLLSL